MCRRVERQASHSYSARPWASLQTKWPNVAHSGLQDAIDQTNKLIQAFKDK